MLAQQFLSDLRRIDAQRLDVKKKLATAVRASGTTMTEIFGVGPAVAATVLGDVGDISRFPGPGSFAAYNGTAPVEASSGNRVVYRLSLRGNRRMNHAVHMAAVTQVRYPGTEGRAYYDKKITEGKTSKEALRALKRQVSDALYKQMKADARRMADPAGPRGHPGNGSVASVACSHPADRLFGKATPGPDSTLRPQPGPSKAARPGNSPRTRRPVPARTSALSPRGSRMPRAGLRPAPARGRPWHARSSPQPARHIGKQRRRSRHLLTSQTKRNRSARSRGPRWRRGGAGRSGYSERSPARLADMAIYILDSLAVGLTCKGGSPVMARHDCPAALGAHVSPAPAKKCCEPTSI
jgi:transposase IS116/IS110/IS902 family protein